MLDCNKLPEGEETYIKNCELCGEPFELAVKGKRNQRLCKTPECLRARAKKSRQIENLNKQSFIKKERKVKSRGRKCIYMIQTRDKDFRLLYHKCDEDTGLNYYFCTQHHGVVSSGVADIESYI